MEAGEKSAWMWVAHWLVIVGSEGFIRPRPAKTGDGFFFLS